MRRFVPSNRRLNGCGAPLGGQVNAEGFQTVNTITRNDSFVRLVSEALVRDIAGWGGF